MSAYFARHALLPDGWAENVRFEVASSGDFTSVTPDSSPLGATLLSGVALPGMPNVHSHAFQRALAGRTEFARAGGDSFWTWRNAMYAEFENIEADAFEAIATDAYATMLEAGYTTVCEFHYVHRAPQGARYAIRTELADRIVAAARAAGIGLTLLPVLYRYSGFRDAAPLPEQRRFVQSFDEYAGAWHELRAAYASDPQVTLGLAVHSLRAVGQADVRAVVALGESAPGCPLHLHVAEQRAEVEACREACGTTPVHLLSNTVPLGPRWCLVHATHATPAELDDVTRCGAVVGLCPTTEANLGDGIFATAEFIRGGGRIGIGSDSNVTIDVAEELRLLEYVERLTRQQRNVLHDEATPSVARYLYDATLRGGAQAVGRRVGQLIPGNRADLVALRMPPDTGAETTLAMHVFRSGARLIEDVVAGGQLVVRAGRHVRAARSRAVTGFAAL